MKQTLLTVNRRLARTLKADRARKIGPFAAFEGNIIAWDDFLQTLLDAQRCQAQTFSWQLSPIQEQALWAESMQDFPTLGFSRDQTIESARDAYTLVKAYTLKANDLTGYKEDADLFIQAMKSFEQKCAELNAFSRAGLIDQLISSPIKINDEQFYGYGFDEWTPAQKALMNHLQINIETVSQVNHNQKTAKMISKNANDEFYQAVLYAKSVIAQNKNIAIVVPQLHAHWHIIERQLQDIFKSEIPYNISSGESLDKQPVIYALLETFKLLDNDISIYVLTNVLNTPFIKGGCCEAAERAAFDIKLREKESLFLSLDDIFSADKIPALFLKQLQSMQAIKNDMKKQRSMQDWSLWLKEWIEQWGWTSDRTLNSAEYQAVDTFYEILPTLYHLDTLNKKYAFQEYLHALYIILKNNLFQTETQDKPIQVLGLLEAAGLTFDHIWVVGLTSDAYPARSIPHPFIPNHLQLKYDMPHSSPEREVRVAKRLLDRLILGGNNVILSYAAQDKAGEIQLESPLISHIKTNDIKMDLPSRMIDIIAQTSDLKIYEDNIGLPFVKDIFKGGSSVLKDQAACPHRAYVKHRLQGKSPKIPAMGLSASKQGTLVHEILETIWRELKSKQALLALDTESLQSFLQQSIQTVLQNWRPVLSSSHQKIEFKRVMNILTKWFELEKNRSHFTIMQLETRSTVTVNGLTFNVMMDRVDTIDDHILLIDYKTGVVKKSVWDDQRMDEPQLPLYAAFMDPPPSGMAFASLRKNKMGFVGLGSLKMPGLGSMDNTDWDDLLNTFRERLHQLADEIKLGYAFTHPKKGKKSCDKCELQAGCRFYTGGIYAG